ncbi:MAG: hypothetical protein V9F82_09830 [Dermatophilaceae bacterium]
MHLHVDPDDLTAVGSELSSDGPTLRAAAALLQTHRYAAPAAAEGYPELAGAVGEVFGAAVAALGTLADAADVLAWGLDRAGTAYRAVEAGLVSSLESSP